MADKRFRGRDKIVQKMTKDGLVEENLRTGETKSAVAEEPPKQEDSEKDAAESAEETPVVEEDVCMDAEDGEEEKPRRSTAKQSTEYYKAHQEDGKPKEKDAPPVDEDAEPAPKKKGRLSFDDEQQGGIVRGAGLGIGMNGTRAFTKKYGRRQTIGRVQTPTLAMLTERQNKIQNFVKEPYYKVEITGNGIVAESERMVQEQNADTVQAACDGQCAVVGSIERKRKEQSAPKLYDLTTLQREANRYYGFTASQTLKIVQELYEEKLVTYPRTDSQYITEDMQQTMTDLLNHYSGEVGKVEQVVNNKKVTDHHAILPTLESCKRESNSLSGDKEKVFALIVWKMQQAVQPPYIYEDVLVTVCCQDRKFTAKYKNVLQAGHTAMPVPFAEQEKSKDVAFPKKLEQGAVIPVMSAEKKQGFTSPPKAFTEDTLLSAMETAGNKEFEKDTEKKGLGTPATRAAILEKLVSSGYVERKGKQILPSAEGVTAIANIPDYLKSAIMTAEWENELLRMERGETKPANFMQGINGLLDKMLADLRQIPTVQESTTYNKVSIGDCPVCGKPVCEGRQNFYCSDRDCKFALWKESKYLSGMKKTLTKKMATDLLKKGRTHVKDFYSAKKDKTFAADLVMAIENGRAQYSLEFPKTPAKK